MPEDNQAASQTQQPVQEPQQQTINSDFAKQMEASLKPFAPNVQFAQSVEPPVVQPPVNSGEPSVTVEPPVVVPPNDVQADPFGIFKEKFGWQKPEDAITEIEQLRAYRNTPVSAENIKFENDESEKLFKAIAGGKRKEAYQILDRIERIDSLTTGEVTKDNAPDIIKLGMRLKNSDLTQEEIDYRFSKQFSIPKEPVQDVANGEEDADFAMRKEQWKGQVYDAEMNMRIEAKLALPELKAQKANIVFPEIDNPVNEGFVQYQKMLEEEPILNEQIREAYKKITPESLETKIPFIDEANKINFEFQYKPDGASFQKTIDVASDINKLVEHFKKPDGTPDREGFAKAMDMALNYQKVITEAIKQSKNATIKASLVDNGSSGPQRQFPQHQELTDLQKQMEMSLSLNGARR